MSTAVFFRRTDSDLWSLTFFSFVYWLLLSWYASSMTCLSGVCSLCHGHRAAFMKFFVYGTPGFRVSWSLIFWGCQNLPRPISHLNCQLPQTAVIVGGKFTLVYFYENPVIIICWLHKKSTDYWNAIILNSRLFIVARNRRNVFRVYMTLVTLKFTAEIAELFVFSMFFGDVRRIKFLLFRQLYSSEPNPFSPGYINYVFWHVYCLALFP